MSIIALLSRIIQTSIFSVVLFTIIIYAANRDLKKKSFIHDIMTFVVGASIFIAILGTSILIIIGIWS